MHLSINKTVVEDILYTDISDHFRIVILKDSAVVFNHEKEKKQDLLEIQINEKGNYKFLITDENEKEAVLDDVSIAAFIIVLRK